MEELVRNRWNCTRDDSNTTDELATHTGGGGMTRSAVESDDCVEGNNNNKGFTTENLEKVSKVFKTLSECRGERLYVAMQQF
jgi:hypothetical protein